ncbi:hypothetical protein PFISCL1PPCAC_26523, partial [Pristionchus fissidentatus]
EMAQSAGSPRNPREKERPYRIDPEDEEYIKDLQRPAVIKADLSEMERRKKVHELLESKSFCRQIETAMRSDLEESVVPSAGLYPIMQTPSKSRFRVPPIADLLPEEFTQEEREKRTQLACFLRAIDHFHWSSSFNSHVSIRLSSNAVFTQPIGLFYHEIRASSLLKVDMQGEILDQGTTRLGINELSFSLHTSIFSTRDDVTCIAHLQSPIITAVSALKCGLLPICPEATFLGPVGYFDFFGALSNDDNERLQNAVGNIHVLVIRNNGIIAMGRSVEETALYVSHIVRTCDIQIRAAKAGIDNIHVPTMTKSDEEGEPAMRSEINGNTELNDEVERENEEKRRPSEGKIVGSLEWESCMRALDTQGLGTGHVYRQPFWNNNESDENNMDGIDELVTASSYRKSMSSKWTSSPIKYQRIDVLEKGTISPKKLTKWIADAHNPSQSGTPVKISTVHQFAPLSPTTKDFKAKQRLLKDTRITGTLNPGPQSHVMTGHFTETDGPSQIPEDRSVLIGCASRGIIQRDYRCHAQVYRQLYAANPFRENVDEDLDRYLKDVEKRSARSKSCDPLTRTATRQRDESMEQMPSTSGLSKAVSTQQISEQSPKKDRRKKGLLSYLRRKLL